MPVEQKNPPVVTVHTGANEAIDALRDVAMVLKEVGDENVSQGDTIERLEQEVAAGGQQLGELEARIVDLEARIVDLQEAIMDFDRGLLSQPELAKAARDWRA